MDLIVVIDIMSEDVLSIAYTVLGGAVLDEEFPLRPVSPSTLIGKRSRMYVTPEECTMLTIIYLHNLRVS